MPDLRRITFVSLSCVLLFGTIYSVAYHTYIDTSDPVVALGRTPHPLAESSYFARKDNVLNTLFIKKAWGWTTTAFVALLLTAPPPRPSSSRRATMTLRERLGKWVAATGVWLLFVVWFFGPGVMERVLSLSGAECVMRVPSGDVLAVPTEYCVSRTIVSPATHPELFILSPKGIVEGNSDWRTLPRMMRGHDVSGHVFLVTMSLLFLADMVRPSFSIPKDRLPAAHRYALLGTGALMLIWMFALFTTALYFHTPFEKLTGYCKCCKTLSACPRN